MQDALETFEAYASVHQWVNARSLEVMYALRDRLAQPEPEPVAWMQPNGKVYTAKQCTLFSKPPGKEKPNQIPLYTAPPKREWVGLTDEEVEEIVVSDCNMEEYFSSAFKLSRQVEAKLKEKNT